MALVPTIGTGTTVERWFEKNFFSQKMTLTPFLPFLEK